MTAKAAVAQNTRVFVLAESNARRAQLRALLSRDPDFELVTGMDANKNGVPLPETADVLVVDVQDGAALPGPLLVSSKSGMVLLSNNPESHWITRSSGLLALLKRNSNEKQILSAVHAVAAGLTVLEPGLVERLLGSQADAIALEPDDEELTPRETEVLHMMTAGLTNREIASALGISEHTVKFHIASIFGKLGSSTRTEAVTEGIRRGLILL